jgi:AraC-like DNA-binding protein
MHLARELLATTRRGIADIARSIGYDSEEAFSRAYKRTAGSAPSAWRAARNGPQSSELAADSGRL